MPRILAIEADPKRKRLLATLIREHVRVELLMADSVKTAIKILDEKVPDLIIAPTLLSPADSAELMTHLKGLHSAPYVQTLTVPALDMLAEPPRDEQRRFGVLGHVFKPMFSRRRVDLGPQYDRAILGAQIVDGIDRARMARVEHEAFAAYREEIAKRQAIEAAAALSKLGTQLAERSAAAAAAPASGGPAARRALTVDERRAAERKRRADIPWLSAVKLSWGPEVAVVNISSSGVLMETGSKFIPGSTADLHLTGPETTLVVPVRFIRSEVSRIDGLGVKYHAAAAFENELDLLRPRNRSRAAASRPEALASLLAESLAETAERSESAQARFTRGLRQLFGARDVQIRLSPCVPSGGRETLYFDIPGTDRACAILQVVFERNYDVNETEFRLLKAAAWLAAAVLELDSPRELTAGHQTNLKLLTDRVA
jgi:CheY-like chemotaxis protein